MAKRYRLPVYATATNTVLGRIDAQPDGWFYPRSEAERSALLGAGCLEDDVDVANVPVPVSWDITNQKLKANGAEISSLVSGGGWNGNPHPLRKWAAAIGKMRNGGRNAKLLIAGDSTSTGSGATGVTGYGAGGRAKSLPVRLAAELNRTYYPSNAHAMWGDGGINDVSIYQSFDPRLVAQATWTHAAAAQRNIGGYPLRNTGTVSYFDFTPSVAGSYSASVDSFVVWFYTSVGGGVFSWAIDGGAATNVSTNAASGITSVAIPAGSLAGHTLRISWVSGGTVWIAGIQAFDSTTKQIEVWGGGIGGADTQIFTQSAYPWSNLNMLAAIAPDLVVVQHQINDVLYGNSLALFSANLETYVSACQSAGADVILRSGYPSGITNASLELQTSYRDAIATVALKLGLLFDDNFGRCGSYEIQQAVPGGGNYADSLHPSGNLYAGSASALAGLLRAY